MNLPNRLTVARILLAPVFLILLMVDFPCHYLAAGLVFGAAALTDLFDGKIARGRGLVTNLGKFLDPIADKMLTTAAFLGFLAVGKLDVFAVMLILSREFMVTSVRLMAAKGDVVMAASIWGQGKTVAQFTSILVMLVALEFSTWANRHPGGRSFAGDGFYAAGSFRSDPHLGVGGADPGVGIPVRVGGPSIFCRWQPGRK